MFLLFLRAVVAHIFVSNRSPSLPQTSNSTTSLRIKAPVCFPCEQNEHVPIGGSSCVTCYLATCGSRGFLRPRRTAITPQFTPLAVLARANYQVRGRVYVSGARDTAALQLFIKHRDIIYNASLSNYPISAPCVDLLPIRAHERRGIELTRQVLEPKD